MSAPKPIIRHRPRSFANTEYARCGVKRDLQNEVILRNRNITCPECKAIQAKYKERAQAELAEMMAKPRKGPLRMPLVPLTPAQKRRHYAALNEFTTAIRRPGRTL